MVVLFSAATGAVGSEDEAAKVDKEDEKITELVEECGNGCHKLSSKRESFKPLSISWGVIEFVDVVAVVASYEDMIDDENGVMVVHFIGGRMRTVMRGVKKVKRERKEKERKDGKRILIDR